MALERDLTNLPREAAGLTPDREPRFVQLLAEAWAEADRLAGDKPRASATARFRHSDAGKCARLISYKAIGLPASDPMDLSGVNNVHLGSIVHEHWQAALLAAHPTAIVEAKVDTLDGDGAGHIDAVIVLEDRRVAYELKTIGGYGYKASIGKARKGMAAEGPKSDHLLQGALNALACDADELVIGYLAKEAISVNAAGTLTEVTRFACEWTFTREQFEPLARDELTRIAGILALVDDGLVAARKIPDLPPSAEIVDPIAGRWEQRGADGTVLDTDTHWSCGYCSHQSLCASTVSGRQPIDAIVAISTKGAA